MQPVKKGIFTINGGSSSIKFALYEAEGSLTQLLQGEIKGIGSSTPKFVITHVDDADQQTTENIELDDYVAAINFLLNWIKNQNLFSKVNIIGHRIVHGMQHTQPEPITDKLLSELKAIITYDPEHMPGEIKLVEAFKNQYPALTQVACFDTSFHTTMPPVAKLLPIPRRYQSNGIQRYGFHGLSYSYLLEELERVAGSKAAQGKIILAHLGSGASLAAVKDGKSIDTSMGFTPSSGLPMSTRTGDIDPGVMLYLMKHENLGAQQIGKLINHQSGLLGISETSSEMQELLKNEASDNRAAEAVELFCYQTKKWIGSFAAALGGLDALIFSGGMGEHSAEIRKRLCSNLQFLGIETDENRNLKNEAIISTDRSTVTIRVIKTNEELMIAKLTCRIMNSPVTL